MFYCYQNNQLRTADSVPKLLVQLPLKPKRNARYLKQILLDGFFAGEDCLHETLWQGVYRVPLGYRLTPKPDAQGRCVERAWSLQDDDEVARLTLAQAQEALREHLLQAVERCLPKSGAIAVELSGGLDSSSILCQAETLRRNTPGRYPPILGVSYTSPAGSPSDETAFLPEIEREYGITIERTPVGPPGFLDMARDLMWHTEGPLLDETWKTADTFFKTTHRLGTRVVLTGHWADQFLFNRGYLIDLVYRLAWGKVHAHLKEFGRWLTDVDPACFRRQFIWDLARYHVPDRLVPLLRKLRPRREPPWYTAAFRKRARRPAWKQQTGKRGPFPTAHARSLYEEATSGHHALSMEWDNKAGAMYGLEMGFPFLDRDLLSFFIGIPGEIQAWRGVPKAMLRQAMRGVLPVPILERRWKADFTDLANEGMARDYSGVVSCLQPDAMAVECGYLRTDRLRSELHRLKDRIRGPDCAVTWNLMNLLGLEFFLQVFFAKRTEQREGPRALGGGPGATATGGAR